jgi:hypothetical protein
MTAIGFFFTGVALLLTCNSNANEQKWKVAELKTSLYKEFTNNSSVKAVHQMLDYKERNVQLADTTLFFNYDTLYAALNPSTKMEYYQKKLIRDAFDEYFDQLSLLNQYIDEKLIYVRKMLAQISFTILKNLRVPEMINPWN